jgi:hypothetical protein
MHRNVLPLSLKQNKLKLRQRKNSDRGGKIDPDLRFQVGNENTANEEVLHVGELRPGESMTIMVSMVIQVINIETVSLSRR